jgi:hypothetical protein
VGPFRTRRTPVRLILVATTDGNLVLNTPFDTLRLGAFTPVPLQLRPQNGANFVLVKHNPRASTQTTRRNTPKPGRRVWPRGCSNFGTTVATVTKPWLACLTVSNSNNYDQNGKYGFGTESA